MQPHTPPPLEHQFLDDCLEQVRTRLLPMVHVATTALRGLTTRLGVVFDAGETPQERSLEALIPHPGKMVKRLFYVADTRKEKGKKKSLPSKPLQRSIFLHHAFEMVVDDLLLRKRFDMLKLSPAEGNQVALDLLNMLIAELHKDSRAYVLIMNDNALRVTLDRYALDSHWILLSLGDSYAESSRYELMNALFKVQDLNPAADTEQDKTVLSILVVLMKLKETYESAYKHIEATVKSTDVLVMAYKAHLQSLFKQLAGIADKTAAFALPREAFTCVANPYLARAYVTTELFNFLPDGEHKNELIEFTSSLLFNSFENALTSKHKQPILPSIHPIPVFSTRLIPSMGRAEDGFQRKLISHQVNTFIDSLMNAETDRGTKIHKSGIVSVGPMVDVCRTIALAKNVKTALSIIFSEIETRRESGNSIKDSRLLFDYDSALALLKSRALPSPVFDFCHDIINALHTYVTLHPNVQNPFLSIPLTDESTSVLEQHARSVCFCYSYKPSSHEVDDGEDDSLKDAARIKAFCA